MANGSARMPRVSGGRAGNQLSRRALLRTGFFAGAGTLVGGPLLAACGSDDEPDGQTGENAPQGGGELVLGIPHSPVGFDPYQLQAVNMSIDNNCYQNLIAWAGQGFEVVGEGLESWTWSEDGMEGEIKLRPDMTFHSGSPITADDVVAVFERAMSDDGLALTSQASILSGVTKVDDLTVNLGFNEAIAETVFTDMLTGFPLVDKELNSSGQLTTELGGSGPFKLVEYKPNVEIVLERFEDYYEPDLPLLDRLVLKIFGDPETMVSALRAGEVDAAVLLPLRSMEELEGEGFNIVNRGTHSNAPGAVGLNPTAGPFQNKMVRQAIGHSINRERIAQDVFFGNTEPIGLPFLPESPVYGGQTDVPETEFDLTEAKRLLDDSGETNLSAEALTGDNVNALGILQIMQADLKEIGFDLKINQIDQQTYVDRFRSGDVEIFYHGTGGDKANPFAKTVIPEFIVENNPFWGDDLPADFKDGMTEARTALNEDDFAAANKKIRSSVIDEAWCFGVVLETQWHGTSADVEGVEPVEGKQDVTSMARAVVAEG